MKSKLFQVLSLITLVLVITGCSHLLYPGDRFPYLVPEQIKPHPTDLKIPVLNSSTNESLHAWYFATSQKKRNGLVILFHGNGQNLTTHFLFFKWVIDYGYDFLIFDYRGYGASSGDRASQQKTVEDGLSVIDYARKNFADVPLVTIGQSLGSAILDRTLQELKKANHTEIFPQLVVFDSSFISYQAAARSTLSQRWFLYPLKPLTYFVIDDDWSPKANLENQPSIPALFFHNQDDPIIHIDLGQEAFDSWRGPKFFIKDKDGGHTSAFADPRFVENRVTLIRCLDFVINKKKNLEECIKK